MSKPDASEASRAQFVVEDAFCLVVEQGLTPAMARRACNIQDAQQALLSRKITEAVNEVAAAEFQLERLSSINSPPEIDETAQSSRKRSRSGSSTTNPVGKSNGARSITPIPSSFGIADNNLSSNGASSHPHISHLHANFTAPYLNRGRERGSHFRRKVEKAKEELRKNNLFFTPPATKNVSIKKTRLTSRQQNTAWINKKSANDDRDKRYGDAAKEAVEAFSSMKQGKSEWSNMTQQGICDTLNTKFSLDGEGREGSREQKKLTVRTVNRWIENGYTEAPKKGKAPKIDRNLLRLVALHANMCQVGMIGEVTPAYLKGLLLASVLGTVHQDTFHLEYAWEVCRRENCEILEPSGRIMGEDIRWQWVTHQNLVDYLDMLKAEFLKYGFARDIPHTLPDNTICDITMIPDMMKRLLFFDETDHVLGNQQDKSGTRTTTYVNPKLNRAGSRHCRGTGGHVTGGYSVSGDGEFVPPLFIFSSDASEQENMSVNEVWIQNLGRTKGRFGHSTEKSFSPFIAARSSGSMDVGLFLMYIEQMTKLLYPKESISPRVEFDSNGALVKGPVLWITDTGPGRLSKPDGDFRSKDGETYDEVMSRLQSEGILINGLLPNSTAVTAVMDELYRAFKGGCRTSTQQVYAQKLQDNAREVIAKKKDLAVRHSRGEKIPQSEYKKINTVVSLDRKDLGAILYGELDSQGLPHPESPIGMHFTKEKIDAALHKLGFNPFTKGCLNNTKVRHEIGQDEDTNQTSQMEELRNEYQQAREECKRAGFETDVFDAVLPTTTPIERASTSEERINTIAELGQVNRASGLFRCLGSMMFNGDEILAARKLDKEMKKKAADDKKKAADEKEAELYLSASTVYQKFVEEHDRDLGKLSVKDLSILVKFLVSVDKQGQESASKYTNKGSKVKRIREGGSVVWTSWFDPEFAEQGGEESLELPTAAEAGSEGNLAAI